ncbi:hypothetical protein LIER_00293 [Lithospermum erythrorhizon]|uniref:Uncharacterized protein n=1 Tax=Lithospermum erythrorhizon TaxID=34254 RepID=A0AAV3NHD7_LITER
MNRRRLCAAPKEICKNAVNVVKDGEREFVNSHGGDAKVASKACRFRNSKGIRGDGFNWIRSKWAEGCDKFVQVDDFSRINAKPEDVFLKGVEAFIVKMNKEIAIIGK